MWTTSHQSSNGKPTRASWPRTSAVSGITCRSQWTQESILFFLTFLIIFYDFKIKWNKARTIVQVEAVDLDKRGTQNSHVRYEIIKVSSKILLLKTMLGKAMFGQNILIVFQDMECASPKMFDSVVCFRETTRTSSQSTRRAGRSRWWSLWSSSGTGEREDLSRRSSRSSRCRCRASSSCFRPGLVCSPDCSDCFTMVGLKWIIKSRNNDQNITSSLQVAISMYLSSHPTSKMVKETGFKKWKLGASIWLGNSIPWQRGAGQHIHPRHPEEVRSYHLCVRNQNPFCRDFFAFKPDWLKFRVVRLILPEAASTLSQVLHRSSSAKSSSPLSSPSHPKHSNQNGIRIKRCFPRWSQQCSGEMLKSRWTSCFTSPSLMIIDQLIKSDQLYISWWKVVISPWNVQPCAKMDK